MNKIVLCLIACASAISFGVHADSQANTESKLKFSPAALRERGFFEAAVREGRAQRHAEQTAITRLRHMHGLSFVQQLIWDDDRAVMRLFSFHFPKTTHIEAIAPAVGKQPSADGAWFQVKVGEDRFEYAVRRYEITAQPLGLKKIQSLRVQREFTNASVRAVLDEGNGRKLFLHYPDRVARIVELPDSVSGDVVGFRSVNERQLEVETSRLVRYRLEIDPDVQVRELRVQFGTTMIDLAELRVGESTFDPCADQLTTPR